MVAYLPLKLTDDEHYAHTSYCSLLQLNAVTGGWWETYSATNL